MIRTAMRLPALLLLAALVTPVAGDDRGPSRGRSLADRLDRLERRLDALEERRGAEHPAPPSPESADLTGRWLLTLPAGFEYLVALEPRGDGYRLDAPELALNHEGTYRRIADRLEIVRPDDERLTGFGWRVHNANVLILVDQPDLARTGSDYRGATLTRQVR